MNSITKFDPKDFNPKRLMSIEIVCKDKKINDSWYEHNYYIKDEDIKDGKIKDKEVLKKKMTAEAIDFFKRTCVGKSSFILFRWTQHINQEIPTTEILFELIPNEIKRLIEKKSKLQLNRLPKNFIKQTNKRLEMLN